MKALSTRNDAPQQASRPFDAERDGFVMGEGAGILILEEREFALARGAQVYAEIVGYGISGDAYHISAPSVDGDGAIRAMRTAIESAGIEPTEVDYINAHGTSTPAGDRVETIAVKEVFGGHAREQDAGEHLADRPDLVDGVRVGGALVPRHLPEAGEVRVVGAHDPDREPDDLASLDVRLRDAGDIGFEFARQHHGRGQEQGEEETKGGA